MSKKHKGRKTSRRPSPKGGKVKNRWYVGGSQF